jgi:hypothetical protein
MTSSLRAYPRRFRVEFKEKFSDPIFSATSIGVQLL